MFHLDTSDHRTTANIGALDFTNVYLGLKNYVQLSMLCLRHRPDLIYIPISQTALGFFRDSGFFIIPKILCRTKVVIHLRGGYFGDFYTRSPGVVRHYVDFAMKLVDRAIVLGEVFRPIFHRWLPDERIDVAPNGTDLVVPNVENKFRRSDVEPVTITYMSNLIPTKGIMEFVRSAAKVAAERDDVAFMVAGGWWGNNSDFRKKVETAILAGGLRHRLRMLGPVEGETKLRLLYDTDVFVLPTYYPFEGHPNSIVEAMAAGCAVVATDHAAIPETVVDRETGFIVPVRCVDPLTDAILRLTRDRAMLREFALASYRRYQQHYTVARNVDTLSASLLRAYEARKR